MATHHIHAATADELDQIVRYCLEAYEVVDKRPDLVVLRRVPRSYLQHFGDILLGLLGQGVWTGRDRSTYPKAVLDIPVGTEMVEVRVDTVTG